MAGPCIRCQLAATRRFKLRNHRKWEFCEKVNYNYGTYMYTTVEWGSFPGLNLCWQLYQH
jgi:hypothetical protein